VYSRQQDTPKGGKQASLCRALEPWPYGILRTTLSIRVQSSQFGNTWT